MTDTPSPDFSNPAVRRQVNVVFASLMLALLLAALDSTIVSTALPTIVSDLGGLRHLSWVVTAYILANTVVTPIYGKLGDIFGRKLMLQSAIITFLAGSVLCGVAQTMGQLIVFRAIQGIGGGGLLVTVMTSIADLVPLRERGRYQGLTGAVFGLSTIIGPLLGGLFVDHLTWRWIFFINLPLGLIALGVIAAVFAKPAERQGRPQIDYLGAILLGAALTALVLFSSLGGATYAWGSPQIIGLGAGAVLLTAAFLVVEAQAPDAIMPLSIYSHHVVVVGLCIGFAMGIGLLGSLTYLPLYLQVVKGLSPSTSGLTITPMMAGMLVSSIGAGRVISRTGRYRLFPIFGTGISALAILGFALIPTAASTGYIVAAAVLLGLGMGMVQQVIVLAIQNTVPRHQLGVATASNSLVRSIGSSLGVSAFGTLMNLRLGTHLAGGGEGHMDLSALARLSPAARAGAIEAFADALHLVFAVGAGILAVAFALSLTLRETPLQVSSRGKATGA